MVWLAKLFAGHDARAVPLTSEVQERLSAWRKLPAPDLTRSHYRSRYVLIDISIAGSDWKGGPLGSIGALALVDGLIDFQDALHLAMVHPAADAGQSLAEPPPATPISGEQRRAALLSLLGFVGKAPLVAYHASFVARRIERALAEALDVELKLPWIDLAWVMAGLFGELGEKSAQMDAWLEHFGIDSVQRHNPVSDAYATAQLLQLTLARAAHKGFETPASLIEIEKARRHLYQSG
ncbi:MAG: DNA polymerase III subunit epsilon [Candidatus Accumulibacter regalis]|jgi:DNA polymerase-3 subunit epsilon|uniref:DNA polymerase III subunit epsilon n=2 Tax=Candidatus Accumulibacter TaxID=327159 RepID=A0A011P694_ACCRE|nr:MAG: DNA polymerase III subunit epsilon [Candidatus Accumulibacter regalis]